MMNIQVNTFTPSVSHSVSHYPLAQFLFAIISITSDSVCVCWYIYAFKTTNLNHHVNEHGHGDISLNNSIEWILERGKREGREREGREREEREREREERGERERREERERGGEREDKKDSNSSYYIHKYMYITLCKYYIHKQCTTACTYRYTLTHSS